MKKGLSRVEDPTGPFRKGRLGVEEVVDESLLEGRRRKLSPGVCMKRVCCPAFMLSQWTCWAGDMSLGGMAGMVDT